MTVLCGACSAENRDAAKFCKGCGRKIAQAWPQPAVAAVVSGSTAVSRDAAMAPRASGAALSPSSSPSPAPAPDREASLAFEPERNGRAKPLAIVAASVVLVAVAAVAWWLYANRGQEIAAPTPAAAPTVDVSAPRLAPEPAASPQLPQAPVVMPQAAPLAEAAAPAPLTSSEPAPAQGKPRKTAKKQPAPAPAPVVEAVAPPPPPAVVEPVRPPSPQEACAGRNFIARAQCLADQCAKSDVAGHPQCEAVRRQQRIEEEKRNPTMAG